MTNWFEPLPDKCPPETAFIPNGQVFYRLAKSGTVISEEFLSQRAKCPTCKFNDVTECVARSISLWNDISECLNVLKLPRHKKHASKSVIMILTLNSNDGLLLNTFKPNHFSWWRSNSFILTSVTITK